MSLTHKYPNNKKDNQANDGKSRITLEQVHKMKIWQNESKTQLLRKQYEQYVIEQHRLEMQNGEAQKLMIELPNELINHILSFMILPASDDNDITVSPYIMKLFFGFKHDDPQRTIFLCFSNVRFIHTANSNGMIKYVPRELHSFEGIGIRYLTAADSLQSLHIHDRYFVRFLPYTPNLFSLKSLTCVSLKAYNTRTILEISQQLPETMRSICFYTYNDDFLDARVLPYLHRFKSLYKLEFAYNGTFNHISEILPSTIVELAIAFGKHGVLFKDCKWPVKLQKLKLDASRIRFIDSDGILQLSHVTTLELILRENQYLEISKYVTDLRLCIPLTYYRVMLTESLMQVDQLKTLTLSKSSLIFLSDIKLQHLESLTLCQVYSYILTIQIEEILRKSPKLKHFCITNAVSNSVIELILSHPTLLSVDLKTEKNTYFDPITMARYCVAVNPHLQYVVINNVPLKNKTWYCE
jgi:hypothetical protein